MCLKYMKFVLPILRDKLLHLNHRDNFGNSLLSVFTKVFKLWCEQKMLESSANNTNDNKGVVLVKSLI